MVNFLITSTCWHKASLVRRKRSTSAPRNDVVHKRQADCVELTKLKMDDKQVSSFSKGIKGLCSGYHLNDFFRLGAMEFEKSLHPRYSMFAAQHPIDCTGPPVRLAGPPGLPLSPPDEHQRRVRTPMEPSTQKAPPQQVELQWLAVAWEKSELTKLHCIMVHSLFFFSWAQSQFRKRKSRSPTGFRCLKSNSNTWTIFFQ